MPLDLAPDGFHFPKNQSESEPIEVKWEQVDEIVTWKDDLWAYDDIRLGFHLADTGLWISLSEEQPGFCRVVEEMERRFPAIPGDWFQRVMFPAFVPNYAVLFRRVGGGF